MCEGLPAYGFVSLGVAREEARAVGRRSKARA